WDILAKCHEGNDKLKKVRLQTWKRKFELLQIEDNETITTYFNRITNIANQIRSYGETLADAAIVEKVIRTLAPKFDYITVAIMESKYRSTMTLDELQCSLESHDQRLNERQKDRAAYQALQAHAIKKGSGKWKGKDKRYGHFAKDCRAKKIPRYGGKNKAEAHIAQEDSDSEVDPTLLMATTTDDEIHQEHWYLDTGCSNHMTSHRDWLINFNSSSKTKIRFTDNRTIPAEGVGDVLIKGKKGNQA
ncbi:F-box protein, partial [Trifolium pratense]